MLATHNSIAPNSKGILFDKNVFSPFTVGKSVLQPLEIHFLCISLWGALFYFIIDNQKYLWYNMLATYNLIFQ